MSIFYEIEFAKYILPYLASLSCIFRTSYPMEPGRQSLSSYHGNRINETGDGGTYADSRESDFSTSAVHRLSLEKQTPRRIAVV